MNWNEIFLGFQLMTDLKTDVYKPEDPNSEDPWTPPEE
jgi:hypothetical protein